MELTWDLTKFYKTKADYYKDFEKFKALCATEQNFKGKLGTRQGLLDYYKLQDKIGLMCDKLAMYLHFAGDIDGSDAEILEMQQELDNFLNNYEQSTLFASQEIKKIPASILQAWSREKEFKNYSLTLKHLAENKKHILSEPQEKLLTQMSNVYNADEVFNTLNDVDIKFGKVKDENGNSVEMTHGNMGVLASSYIRSVRKPAEAAMLKPYKDFNQTIAANFISFLKYCHFTATASKYKNTLQAKAKRDYLPETLPSKVVKNVTEYLPLLHKYFSWRKKYMGIKDFEVCDAVCEMYGSNVSPKYTMESCIDTLKEALSPLGQDYTDMLDVAVKDGWIDSIERPNKCSGAYSAEMYSMHPFILFTFDGTADSVSALAHEFGHAMHSYYSCKAQPYATHDYGIFLAEMASTVNEILLAKYQIANAKTKEQKIDNLWRLADGFFGTVFMQTMYTEFELFAHGSVENDIPLTYKKLNDCFDDLHKKYFGKEVKINQYRKYHWCRVPHFYRPFYVYKYATGYIVACAIVQKVLSDPSFANVYKTKFLSAGSRCEPCDVLKDIGIDIMDKNTYKAAFTLLEDVVDQLQKLTD